MALEREAVRLDGDSIGSLRPAAQAKGKDDRRPSFKSSRSIRTCGARVAKELRGDQGKTAEPSNEKWPPKTSFRAFDIRARRRDCPSACGDTVGEL